MSSRWGWFNDDDAAAAGAGADSNDCTIGNDCDPVIRIIAMAVAAMAVVEEEEEVEDVPPPVAKA